MSLKPINSPVEEVGEKGNTPIFDLWPYIQGTVYVSVVSYMAFVGLLILEPEVYSYHLFLADTAEESRHFFLLSLDWTSKFQELARQNAITYAL